MAAAAEDAGVHLSAPLLARLLQTPYVLDDGDKLGLLFGRTHKTTVTENEDHHADVSRDVTSIAIDSYLCIGSTPRFIKSTGDIDDYSVRNFVADRKKVWLGWAVFRHNTHCRPSIREVKAHKQMRSLHKELNGGETFVFGIFTSYLPYADERDASNSMSDVYEYKFFSIPATTEKAQVLPSKVHNLGQNGQNEYGSVVFQNPAKQLANMVGSQFTGEMATEIPPGVTQLQSMLTQTMSRIDTSAHEIIHSDDAVMDLTCRVQRLRTELCNEEKRRTKAFVVNTPLEPPQPEVPPTEKGKGKGKAAAAATPIAPPPVAAPPQYKEFEDSPKSQARKVVRPSQVEQASRLNRAGDSSPYE